HWHRLTADINPPAERAGAHLRVFVAATPRGRAPHVDWSAAEPFADPAGPWTATSADAPDYLFPAAPRRDLWVGIHLTGEGQSSYALSQLRIDFDQHPYLDLLPQVLQETPPSREFLIRVLSLLGGRFEA